MIEVFQLTVKYRGVTRLVNYYPKAAQLTNEEKKEAKRFWNRNNRDETGYINTIKRRLLKICIFENRDCNELHPILEKILRADTPMICDKCLLNANFNMIIDSKSSAQHFKSGLTSMNNPLTCYQEKKICNCLLVQIFNRSSVYEHASGFVSSTVHKNVFTDEWIREDWYRFTPSFTNADFRVINTRVIQSNVRSYGLIETAGGYELDESNFEIEIRPGEDYHPRTVNQSIRLERESARLNPNQIYHIQKEIQAMKDTLAAFEKVTRYFYHNVAEQIIGRHFLKHQAADINEVFAEIVDMIASR